MYVMVTICDYAVHLFLDIYERNFVQLLELSPKVEIVPYKVIKIQRLHIGFCVLFICNRQ